MHILICQSSNETEMHIWKAEIIMLPYFDYWKALQLQVLLKFTTICNVPAHF